MNTELEQAIDALVTKQTFSLDAVRGIEQMRKDAVMLREAHDVLSKSFVDCKRRNAELETLNNDLLAREKSVNERAAAVQKRETEITKLEVESKYAELRRSDMKEVVMALCRNTTVRESILGSDPLAMTGTNGCGPYISSGEVRRNVERTTE